MEDKFFEAKYPQESWEKEIDALLTFIHHGDSCQLVSVPGAGRSNILGALAYNKHIREHHLKEKKEKYHFVMVSFTEIKHRPQIEAIKLILLNLVASLEDRPLGTTYEKAKQIMTESFVLHDELVLLQALKRVVDLITLENDLTLVLLFDQFESYIPMLTTDFFGNMKILRNRAKYKFSIVFSLHKPLEYLLEPTLFQDFAEYSENNIVYLPLHDTPSLSFRIKYIEEKLEKSLDPKTKDALLQMTAGHSKLARLGTQLLLSEKKTPSDVQEFLLTQKQIVLTLATIWQSLNPAEQTHFQKKLFPAVLDDEHSRYLQNVGLMTETSIALPLFEAFITTMQKGKEVKSPTITYDLQTKAIKKGEMILSEQLTATEFRLLKFFLEHADKILERNTIIESVWHENKSIAGVSDQALDQLIFRLRKKIEEDPNNPNHIVTVKGRGFRFTP